MLKPVVFEDEKYFFSLSFDINDFVGDGVWWLQVYDSNQNLVYDKPFAPSQNKLGFQRIRETINNEFVSYRGCIL